MVAVVELLLTGQLPHAGFRLLPVVKAGLQHFAAGGVDQPVAQAHIGFVPLEAGTVEGALVVADVERLDVTHQQQVGAFGLAQAQQFPGLAGAVAQQRLLGLAQTQVGAVEHAETAGLGEGVDQVGVQLAAHLRRRQGGFTQGVFIGVAGERRHHDGRQMGAVRARRLLEQQHRFHVRAPQGVVFLGDGGHLVAVQAAQRGQARLRHRGAAAGPGGDVTLALDHPFADLAAEIRVHRQRHAAGLAHRRHQRIGDRLFRVVAVAAGADLAGLRRRGGAGGQRRHQHEQTKTLEHGASPWCQGVQKPNRLRLRVLRISFSPDHSIMPLWMFSSFRVNL